MTPKCPCDSCKKEKDCEEKNDMCPMFKAWMRAAWRNLRSLYRMED